MEGDTPATWYPEEYKALGKHAEAVPLKSELWVDNGGGGDLRPLKALECCEEEFVLYGVEVLREVRGHSIH